MISHNEAQTLISARQDQMLDPLVERELNAHLATCDACRAFAQSTDALIQGLRTLPYLPASPSVRNAVMERVDRGRSPFARFAGMFNTAPGPALSTFAIIALVLIVGFFALDRFVLQGRDNGDNGQQQLASQPTEQSLPTEDATATVTPTEEAMTFLADETPTATTAPTETPAPTATEPAADTAAEAATEEPTATTAPEPTETPAPTATTAPEPTETVAPTEPPAPTATTEPTPEPTATTEPTPEPTATATDEELADVGGMADESTRIQSAASTPEDEGIVDLTEAPTESPVATPTPEPTATTEPTPEPTVTETPTPEPTATTEPTPEPTATTVATPTPTSEPTATVAPTATPAPTETPAPTATPEPTATAEPTEAEAPPIVPIGGDPVEDPEDEPDIAQATESSDATEAAGTTEEVGTGDDESPMIEPIDGGEAEDPAEETPEAGETVTPEAETPTEAPTETAGVAEIEPAEPGDAEETGSLAEISELYQDIAGEGNRLLLTDEGRMVFGNQPHAPSMVTDAGRSLQTTSAEGGEAVALCDEAGGCTDVSSGSREGAATDSPIGVQGGDVYYVRTSDGTVEYRRATVDGESVLEDVVLLQGDSSIAPQGTVYQEAGRFWIPTAGGDWVMLDEGQGSVLPSDFASPQMVRFAETNSGLLVGYVSGGQVVIAQAEAPGSPILLLPFSGVDFDISPAGDQVVVSTGSSLNVYDMSGTLVTSYVGDELSPGTVLWLNGGIVYQDTNSGALYQIPETGI